MATYDAGSDANMTRENTLADSQTDP